MIPSSKNPQSLQLCYKQQSISCSCEKEDYIPVYYNQSIYIIQCYSALPQKEQLVHVFCIKTNFWKIYTTNTNKSIAKTTPYVPRSSCSRALVGNNLYCFGGRDLKGRPDNRFSVFNLEKKSWKVDIDGSNSLNLTSLSPQSRVNGSLAAYKQSHLILCGGNYHNNEAQHNFNLWVFDLQTYLWRKFYNFVPSIFNTTMIVRNDKMYVFGMKQGGGQHLVSQFYEYPIQLTEESGFYNLEFLKSVNLSIPQRQTITLNLYSNYKLVYHSQRIIFLFEISNPRVLQTRSINTKVWLFDTLTCTWHRTQIQFNKELSEILYNQQNAFYLFELNKPGNISRISLNESEINKLKTSIRFKEWRKCQICYQTSVNNNILMQSAFRVSKHLLNSFTQKIQFPFAAFGIFAEHSHLNNATYINFHYLQYRQQPILKITDDNHANYLNDQLEEVIVNFQAQINYNFGSVQKRVRSLLFKDFIKKQFGANLKIAAMRLGSQMLYISLSPNYQARVAYFLLEGEEYVCYFYAFDQKTKKMVDQYSIHDKIYIQSKYGELIQDALHESISSTKYGPYKNTIYILGLRTVVNQNGKVVNQIQPVQTHDMKDIIYVSQNYSVYKNFLEYGCKINQSVDVSLSVYLSLLFLKNDHMKITLQINKNERKLIRRQDYSQNMDRSALVKIVTSIDFMIRNYDLKSIDLYFNSKLNKKLGIYHNGILLYHRNRLVKRYGCQLGNLLQALDFTDRLSFGYFSIFGRIQLPDSIQVNQQKTDFLNQVMLQKLFSRIKLVHQMLLIKNENEPQKVEKKQYGPRIRLRPPEQFQIKHQPTKKVKKNHDDESYNLY